MAYQVPVYCRRIRKVLIRPVERSRMGIQHKKRWNLLASWRLLLLVCLQAKGMEVELPMQFHQTWN